MLNFGMLLKMARKEMGKTIKEVGDHIGLSVGYISDIEHGRRKPPAMSYVRIIEEYLGVEDNSLVNAAREAMRFPMQIEEMLKKRPDMSLALLRASDDLDDDELQALIRELNERKEARG